MTKYFIDTMTAKDFDAVVRFLLGKNKTIRDRNKIKLEMSAELSEEELRELKELPLEEYVSVGTSSLW